MSRERGARRRPGYGKMTDSDGTRRHLLRGRLRRRRRPGGLAGRRAICDSAWILALFCLGFFRDPDRAIPAGPVAVSPADGKVVAVKAESPTVHRISIFLNIFDVHVNRSPIAGTIREVQYQPGKFHVASREECSDANEQNVVTVEGDGTTVVFKQIAGLIARRIVFRKKAGDAVSAGERVGLIKFGSRVDVMLGPEWEIVVQPGDARGRRIQRAGAPPRSGTVSWGLESGWSIRSSPDRRPRRAAYALPTLFTAGNIFLGYISILRSFRGAMTGGRRRRSARRPTVLPSPRKAIGAAVLLDGLDGRIARMTNTTSDFGREMDSLADVISFGIAPAVLAYRLGRAVHRYHGIGASIRDQIHSAGYFIAFLFLLCGAARLARFNIQKNPIPKNPGRPDRKYFVGLPIPAAAGMVAAWCIAFDGEPLGWWPLSVGLAGAAGCCWAS